MNPITLKKQKLYITSCKCDSFVHKNCLQLWFDKNNNCPICRIIVRDKLSIVNELFSYGIYFTFYIITLSKRILRIFSSLFLIYLFIEYYTMYKIFSNEKFDYLYDYDNFNSTFTN